MTKLGLPLVVMLLLSPSCIKLDTFHWAALPQQSLEDYMGLPLCGNPDSVSCQEDESLLEREVYFSPEGQRLDANSLPETDYLHGAWLQADPASTGPLAGSNVVVVYIHGCCADLFDYWSQIVAIWKTGVHVFAYSWRGYGLSRGEINQANILSDVDAAWLVARQLAMDHPNARADRMVAYAFSSGGTPIATLMAGDSAAAGQIRGAILDSTQDSLHAAAAQSTGLSVPAGFFTTAPDWDASVHLVDVTVPVLHFHGGQDFINFTHQAQTWRGWLRERNVDYLGYIDDEQQTGDPAYHPPLHPLMRGTTHFFVPYPALNGTESLSYWLSRGESSNGCCVNPDELLDTKNDAWIQQVGQTTAQAGYDSWVVWAEALALWIQDRVLP